MSGVAGEILVELTLADDKVDTVAVINQRNLRASQLLVGKTVQQALMLVPLLFSLCGHAQACAAVRACEDALGVPTTLEWESRRDAMVRAETLREHVWRVLLDWPQLVEESNQSHVMQTFLKLLQQYQQRLAHADKLFTLDTDITPNDVDLRMELRSIQPEIETLLQTVTTGMKFSEWLAIERVDDLVAWSQTQATVSARLVKQIIANDWQQSGACTLRPLPALEPTELMSALDHDSFIAQPHWYGTLFETGVLGQVESPLLTDCQQQFGNGLLTRIVARLRAIAQLTHSLTDLTNKSCVPMRSGFGLSQVNTARGLLVHRATIENGIIQDYRILAPTEWNFQPHGVLAQALSHLRGNPLQIECQTRMLINAIDPCVGYRLHIKLTEPAHA